MELQQYLKEIRVSDNKVRGPERYFDLQGEYGIADNFVVFLRATHAQVVALLDGWKKTGEFKQDDGKKSESYSNGRLSAQVYDYVVEGMGFTTFDSQEDEQRQLRDYNRTVSLHISQLVGKVSTKEALEELRDFVLVLGESVQRESIPTCLPGSAGWNHLEDYSRIVYFSPEQK